MPINQEQLQAIQAQWSMRKGYPLQPDKIHEVIPAHRPHVVLPLPGKDAYARDARAIFDVLLSGDAVNPRLIQRYFFSVVGHPPNKLIRAVQNEVQVRLDAISAAITALPLPLADDAKTWVDCKTNNLLSYAAFFEYAQNSTLRVPCFNGTTYQDVLYTVDRLPLTSTFFGSPYCAYGLRPQGKDALWAPSQLLFMGTTYPGSSGFLWTLIADTFPLTSVGDLLFSLGRKTLSRWMSQQSKVIAHGQSLGGSLSMKLARHYPNKVEAFALVPAGHHGLKRQKPVNNITIIFGGNDPVCRIGVMPKGCKYIYALPSGTPPIEKMSNTARQISPSAPGVSSAFKSHALGLACHPKTRLFKVGNAHMITGARSRTALGLIHAASWLGLFPMLLAVTLFNFAIRLAGKALKIMGGAMKAVGQAIMEDLACSFDSIFRAKESLWARAKHIFAAVIIRLGTMLHYIGQILSSNGNRPVFLAPPKNNNITVESSPSVISSDNSLTDESCTPNSALLTCYQNLDAEVRGLNNAARVNNAHNTIEQLTSTTIRVQA